MKSLMATTLGFLIGMLPLSVMAVGEDDAHVGHASPKAAVASEAPMSEGIVKKIDKAAGKVTIVHGPLVNLRMPAMTMAFRVKDVAWLEQMQAGRKIRFLADDVNGTLTVVRFEVAK